jgi:hypothetical protein
MSERFQCPVSGGKVEPCYSFIRLRQQQYLLFPHTIYGFCCLWSYPVLESFKDISSQYLPRKREKPRLTLYTRKYFQLSAGAKVFLPCSCFAFSALILFVNGTTHFKKCIQLFEYQHLPLLRDIWWSRFLSIFNCSSFFQHQS